MIKVTKAGCPLWSTTSERAGFFSSVSRNETVLSRSIWNKDKFILVKYSARLGT